MAEQEDDALLSRRLFAEADVLTVADRRLRARKYEAALEIWKNILLRDPDLRSDGLIQDPLYEYQLKQLYNFNMLPDGGKAMKRELLAQDLIGLALAAPGAVEQRCLTLGQFEQFEKSDQEWPSATIDGPLDGKDQYGRPIIDESIKQICIGRFPDKAAVAGHPIPAPVKKPDGAGAPGDGRGRPGGPGGRGPGGRGPGPRGPGDR
jgi:hypothetical protein